MSLERWQQQQCNPTSPAQTSASSMPEKCLKESELGIEGLPSPPSSFQLSVKCSVIRFGTSVLPSSMYAMDREKGRISYNAYSTLACATC